MKNKKGFTLVELLAVIAILAILVIMALPAVLRMFNNARKDSFTNEVNTVIRTARQQYLLSGGTQTTWSNASGSTSTLDLTGNSHLQYYVKMNNEGKITKLQVTNGDFQYNVANNNGIDVAESSDVEVVTDENELTIIDTNTPTDILYFDYDVIDNQVSITNYNQTISVTYDIDISICKNFIMNSYECTEEQAINYCSNNESVLDTIEKDLNYGNIDSSEYADLGLSNVIITKSAPDHVVIPSSIDGLPVTSIGNSAFYSKGLKSVTIPDTIITIGNSAFEHNELTSVIIPDNITSIGDSAFAINRLTSVIIPNNITSIGYQAFCINRLTSLSIPSSVTSIGSGAFSYNQLTSLIIPSSVTTIGNGAFSNNYLSSLTLSDGLISIGDSAFVYNQLTSVAIPASVTSIYGHSFSGNQLTSVTIESKTTANGFTTYQPYWGWADDVTCVTNNTSNVTNGCITWGA